MTLPALNFMTSPNWRSTDVRPILARPWPDGAHGRPVAESGLNNPSEGEGGVQVKAPCLSATCRLRSTSTFVVCRTGSQGRGREPECVFREPIRKSVGRPVLGVSGAVPGSVGRQDPDPAQLSEKKGTLIDIRHFQRR